MIKTGESVTFNVPYRFGRNNFVEPVFVIQSPQPGQEAEYTVKMEVVGLVPLAVKSCTVKGAGNREDSVLSNTINLFSNRRFSPNPIETALETVRQDLTNVVEDVLGLL
ncbi:MAG: hypothetical protein QOC63_1648 [Mycobacterium sp.]|nr:hypothetical protein [Mycobacterium sp.]